uniref:Oxysterol-binding protein n=1 Tax=Heterorhabditis bacteriophora TaxID=37862 RepID=A0A1I7XT49_HETBA
MYPSIVLSNVPVITMSYTSTRGGSLSSITTGDNVIDVERAGWLNKWTNYLKGYRQRWFVLDTYEAPRTCFSFRDQTRRETPSCRRSHLIVVLSQAFDNRFFLNHFAYIQRKQSACLCAPLMEPLSDKKSRKKGGVTMTTLRGRLRKARKRISGCYIPLRRSRKIISDPDPDIYASAEDFRNPYEVGQSCRGSINLQEARILSDKVTNNIVISASSQTFHLKAHNDVERQKWLTALEYSRHKAIKQAESDEDEDALLSIGETRVEVLSSTHKELTRKLDNLRTAAKLLDKHGEELIRCVNELEIDKKTLCERSALLKITTAAVLKAAEEFVELSDKGSRRMGKVVASEQREKFMLQEQLETLAKQHSSLERAATGTNTFNPPLSAYSDMEDEFHDAAEDLSLTGYKHTHNSLNSGKSLIAVRKESPPPVFTPPENIQGLMNPVLFCARTGRQRRTVIPNRPNLPLNLWSIMKNCIGKELSKIPMPVNFSEPLSVLQRITEDLEYAHLLEEAVTKDPLEQMAFVAAYAVSNYSTTGNRTNKPFNPLLGETYECDRTDDLGWKSIAEQVSHHPPAAAHHAEGKGWVMYQDFTMTSRFRGKYLSVIPVGHTHVYFTGTKNHYSYKKVTTTVHNIIVGKLWIDNHGEMEITNHGTGDKCSLKFIPYSYFSRETPRKIYGVIKDSSGTPRLVVQGTWDKSVEMLKVIRVSGNGDKTRIETDSNSKRIWTVNPPPINSDKMHNFTRLAIELNEPEEGIAPTDSRLRPDQRLMEEGRSTSLIVSLFTISKKSYLLSWDESNKRKLEVEDKQRAIRRRREAEMEKAMQKGGNYPKVQIIAVKVMIQTRFIRVRMFFVFIRGKYNKIQWNPSYVMRESRVIVIATDRGDSGSTTPDAASLCGDRRDSGGRGGYHSLIRGGQRNDGYL